MQKLLIAFAMLLTFSSSACAQKNKKVNKPTAVNADSVYVQQLTDKAKKGDSEAQNELGGLYYLGNKVKRDYTSALKWWSLAAKNNNVVAIANMGLCYQTGHGIKKDSLMAVKLYKQSVKRGNKDFVTEREKAVNKKFNMFDATFLADIYERGDVVTKDMKKALKYYTAASDAGHLESTLKAAKIHEDAKSYPEAFKLYRKASSKSMQASFKTGEFLYKGLGTKVDKAQAFSFLKPAALKGSTAAQIYIGDIYFSGDGMDKDVAEALKWYKMAASNNNPAAMWNVGVIYVNGSDNVKSDMDKGLYWLALASQAGLKKNFQKKLLAPKNSESNGWAGSDFFTYVKGMALLFGNGKNVAEAKNCFVALDKKRISIGTTRLAECYSDVSWKKASAKKAMKYIETSVLQDEPVACLLMAEKYLKGDGVTADKNKALGLVEKAASKGYAQALCRLGDFYAEGKVVNRNLTKAIKYYIEAMNEGYLSPEAAKRLSDCYKQGLGGLTIDKIMAEKVLKKAIDQNPVINLLDGLTFE